MGRKAYAYEKEGRPGAGASGVMDCPAKMPGEVKLGFAKA